MNEVHPLNQGAWEEWVEFRSTEKKKKIGPMAQRKQIQMLCSYPPAEQQAIIDNSIMNSWQGLFPPKQSKQPVVSTRHRSLQDDLNDRSWA